VLRAISGGDDDDASSAGKSFYYAPQFVKKPSELRVGFAPADIAELAEAPTRSAFQAGMEAIRGLGVQMVEMQLPDLPYAAVARTIIAAEGSAVFEPLISSGKVEQLADQKQIAGLRAGLEIPANDYLRAMRIRSTIRDELGKLFTKVDVLVSPSRFSVATKVDAPLDESSGREAAVKPRGLSDLGAAGNLAGLPALSLPCGFADGLPVALQLVGRPFTENIVLALGVEFQRLTDWHRRRPKV
jgi:aspartyl-tRNA(Asn)/glutamyl-tRNA(Gln) amidotransferase subunit A